MLERRVSYPSIFAFSSPLILPRGEGSVKMQQWKNLSYFTLRMPSPRRDTLFKAWSKPSGPSLTAQSGFKCRYSHRFFSNSDYRAFWASLINKFEQFLTGLMINE